MTRLLLAIAVSTAMLFAGSAGAEELLIIGNASASIPTPLSLTQVAAIYLLRVTIWPDGTHIVPVNREANSQVRQEFTAQVLGEDNAELAAYWNEMHFKGMLPPVIQESRQAVIAFVRNVPGSIGYIRVSVLPPGVKVLADVP